MSKTVIRLIASIFLLSSSSYFVAGLKCYHCRFAQGNFPNSNDFESESSCESGKTPDPSLIVNCEDFEYSVHPAQKLALPSSSEDSGEKIQEGQWTFSCFTLNVNGTAKTTGSNVKISFRSCLARAVDSESSSRLPEECISNPNSENGNEIKKDGIQGLLLPLQSLFANTTEAGVCTCNGDNCNGSKKIPGRRAETGQRANTANVRFKFPAYLFATFVFLSCLTNLF